MYNTTARDATYAQFKQINLRTSLVFAANFFNKIETILAEASHPISHSIWQITP